MDQPHDAGGISASFQKPSNPEAEEQGYRGAPQKCPNFKQPTVRFSDTLTRIPQSLFLYGPLLGVILAIIILRIDISIRKRAKVNDALPSVLWNAESALGPCIVDELSVEGSIGIDNRAD